MTENFRLLTTEGIGTVWWIRVFDEIQEDKWDPLKQEILDCIKIFEKNYSRFKPESYIGRLNEHKFITDFPDELYEMFKYSQNIYDITQGNFDIAVGTHLNNLGYDENLSFQYKNKEINIQNSITELSKDKICIAKEILVDLGGIGKGWLIDKISNILKTHDVKYFSINGGGDIFCTQENENKPFFDFYLENPFNNEEAIGTITIQNASIACSSGSKRHWSDKNSGKEFHHLINVKTGDSVKDIISVFTYGQNALSADTASTAIFVSPLNIANQIAEKLNVEYMIIFHDGSYHKTDNYPGKMFG